MLAKVLTCAIVGLEGMIVEVEVDITNGLPSFTLVGLPDQAIAEAKERVRTALYNSGCMLPRKRITINLAPADVKKEGPSYDLPLAVGILIASEQVAFDPVRTVFLGELSLDGSLRPTTGILPMVALARSQGIATAYVPAANAREAGLVEGMCIIPVASLLDLIRHMTGELPLKPYVPDPAGRLAAYAPTYPTDMSDIKGQEHVKRALEVAACGMHNVIMSGPPGTGKTLLARTAPSIMPPMTQQESLEVTKIYSVKGQLPADMPLVVQRPFRAPHHTISHAGLVGGGRIPQPGEISLAHRGILFLDELPEFDQDVLEVMRQPLEDGTVTISRARGTLSYPAKFQLIAAMNPCPCGYFGDNLRACTCSPSTITRYQKKISGPLLDRIDIHIEVPRVEYEKLASTRTAESSATIRERVIAGRERQQHRFKNKPHLTCNADMGPAEVREYCQLDQAGNSLMRAAMNQLGLTARGFTRVLKLARTIADLAGSDHISAVHLAEAIQYRPRRQG